MRRTVTAVLALPFHSSSIELLPWEIASSNIGGRSAQNQLTKLRHRIFIVSYPSKLVNKIV